MHFWANLHWYFLELSLPWLSPWLDYVICDALRSLLWLRCRKSWLKWQKAKPTQPDLPRPQVRRQLPGRVKYKTHPLHKKFTMIQIIMIFPLKQHCSDVSAEVFNLFRNWKLQHFNSSSCWDGNKHRKNWIWPFWFPRPSLNSLGRPVQEHHATSPSLPAGWGLGGDPGKAALDLHPSGFVLREHALEPLSSSSPHHPHPWYWGSRSRWVGDDPQRCYCPHLLSALHSQK